MFRVHASFISHPGLPRVHTQNHQPLLKLAVPSVRYGDTCRWT